MGVSEAAPSLITLDQLRHGRLVAQRLEQLDEIGPLADLKKNFADLVRAEHILAMDLAKPECPISSGLRFELAWAHGDSDVIEKQKSGHGGHRYLVRK